MPRCVAHSDPLLLCPGSAFSLLSSIMAALRVGLYANIGVRAEVADRWEMMQRLLPCAPSP